MFRLVLNRNSDFVKMTIQDQGCGFYYDENLELPSFGLKNMKVRTQSLNGTFLLKSEPGKGTEIQIKIPI